MPQPHRTALDHFRAKTTRQKTHPTESALLWVVSAQLVFLPWALGGMKVWAQWISLGFSVIGFGLALLPRNYGETTSGQAPFRLYTWPKLIRFPIFWLGLAFLAYITIGALNPAWEYKSDGRGWWMVNISHNNWLPTGVRVPFEMWGPWRMLLIYSSVWLTVSAVWIGFTRRKTFQSLFTVLAGNAFVLACVGIAQRATGATKVFWSWTPPAPYFVSSFIYKNHAGAYFNLLLALCAGLAFWHYDRSQRRLDKSSPAGLFAFFGTGVAMIVFFSYSRTATILMFAFLIITFAICTRTLVMTPQDGKRDKLMAVILCVAFIAFTWIGLVSLKTERFMQTMRQMSGQTETINGRTIAARATLDMAKEHAFAGSGAGSFRFLFPKYQQHYPEISIDNGKRMYWEHAHNDYLEVLAEYGLIGVGILGSAILFLVTKLLRLYAWQHSLPLFVVLGLGITAIHSLVDFGFYNIAILTTWCVLSFGTVRWLELEELATSG
jgi:O-antigen ligase